MREDRFSFFAHVGSCILSCVFEILVIIHHHQSTKPGPAPSHILEPHLRTVRDASWSHGFQARGAKHPSAQQALPGPIHPPQPTGTR